MTTNNYYQVNVSNVQGNVNIQINTEKTETVSSPPGPDEHLKAGSSNLLIDIVCLVGIGLIEVLTFGFTKVICPSLSFVAEKTSTILLGEKIETPEVLQDPVMDKNFEMFHYDYPYYYLTFHRWDAPTKEDIMIDVSDRREYSQEIRKLLQKERFPVELYGFHTTASKKELVATLILE